MLCCETMCLQNNINTLYATMNNINYIKIHKYKNGYSSFFIPSRLKNKFLAKPKTALNFLGIHTVVVAVAY